MATDLITALNVTANHAKYTKRNPRRECEAAKLNRS